MKQYTLIVSEEDIGIIDAGLQLLPFGRVVPVAQKINQQISDQNRKLQELLEAQQKKQEDAREEEIQNQIAAAVENALITKITETQMEIEDLEAVLDSEFPGLEPLE